MPCRILALQPLQILDWARPLLPQAVRWLADGWDETGPLDLSHLMAVVPTRQSGRRLREALAAYAAERSQAVFPPTVIVPETLLGITRPDTGVANKHESLFAWIEVLRTVRLEEFPDVFPVPPPERNTAWAARLAREFLNLQSTLAESGLRMSEVVSVVDGPFPEAGRWAQLARLEKRFDQALNAQGLIDRQAARIEISQKPAMPDGVTRIVVLAVPDPMPLALAALERLAEEVDVQTVVYGSIDPAGANDFDRWGRPVPERWRHRAFELEDFESRVRLCPDPAAQADLVADAATRYEKPAEMLAVGVADSEAIPSLSDALNNHNIANHDPEGISRRNEPLYEVVRLLSSLSRDPAFQTVELLARCPDILSWLQAARKNEFSASRFLAGLDALRSAHLPLTLKSARARAAVRDRRDVTKYPEIEPALHEIVSLVDELCGQPFPENIQRALSRIYSHQEFDTDSPQDARTLDTAEAWLDDIEAAAGAVAKFPSIPATDALDLALSIFAEGRRFTDKPAGALDLQGWLELLWEDAPHLVVVGLNDGKVPAAIVDDPFLPETLRETLGLKNNAERYARDKYMLQALASSRAESGRLDLLLGKTTSSGEPLRPSRLLLACRDDELPARVKFLFRELETPATAIPWRRAWQLRPGKPVTISRIPVTGFRGYLACPFRFYLRHGLGMQPVDPHKNELDALDFGTLCHDALEAFGRDESVRMSADVKTIRNFMLEKLERRAAARYGNPLPLTVSMQLESARQRLGKAAEIQAQLREEGWLIQEIEHGFELDLEGIQVRGKIDRIDRHEETGEIRVLDYKTSDRAVHPLQAHVARMARNSDPEAYPEFSRFDMGGTIHVWTDLQLPLYRRATLSTLGAATCGYFNLPKGIAATGVETWDDFDSGWQEAADRCADGIVAAVKTNQFWPPAEQDERFDEFAHLFHRGFEESIDWPEVTP